MSIGEKGTCVRILDKEFRIGCTPEHESALKAAAAYLDEQMRTVRRTGRVIGMERVTIMAALNITHELLTLKRGASDTEMLLVQRIEALQRRIDEALEKYPSS